MEKILLVATVCALIGAYYVSKADRKGFAIWVFTNIIFATNNFMIGQWQQGILFTCYFALAINGFLNLTKKEKQNEF